MHCSKKLRQCCEAVGDQPESTKLWGIALFATEAIDHLSARLQHLDASGYALKELVSPTGLLLKVQRHTWSLLNPWAVQQLEQNEHALKLSTLLDHLRDFVGESFDKQACYDEFRGFTLTVSSAIWARLELKFWSWPWRLAPLVGNGSAIWVVLFAFLPLGVEAKQSHTTNKTTQQTTPHNKQTHNHTTNNTTQHKEEELKLHIHF